MDFSLVFKHYDMLLNGGAGVSGSHLWRACHGSCPGCHRRDRTHQPPPSRAHGRRLPISRSSGAPRCCFRFSFSIWDSADLHAGDGRRHHARSFDNGHDRPRHQQRGVQRGDHPRGIQSINRGQMEAARGHGPFAYPGHVLCDPAPGAETDDPAARQRAYRPSQGFIAHFHHRCGRAHVFRQGARGAVLYPTCRFCWARGAFTWP